MQICCSHISPPQSLQSLAPQERLRQCVFIPEFCATSQRREEETAVEALLTLPSIKTSEKYITQTQLSIHICVHVTLFLYFKTTVLFAESLGERGCWVDNTQRFSTVLCHPVIRVTGCV